MKIKYSFKGKLWKYPGPASWYFISLPTKLSNEIRKTLKSQEEGWGRLKAKAMVGKMEWDTAIWFDTKFNTYLLPIKKEIRTLEHLEIDDEREITILI